MLENFRPGALEKYGLDAATLLARKPELVYCSINGWGYDNSWSQRRAVRGDGPSGGRAGRLDARLRNVPPEQSPHVDGDITPGLRAVSGIVAALFQRERTGRGQHLDVSMAEALVYTDEWTSTDLAGYDGPRIPDTWNYPIFVVADGTQVAFMGDPHSRLPEVAAALTDVPVPYTESRTRRCGSSPISVRRCRTSRRSRRGSSSRFLVAEVRTVQELAETSWARERDVFVEVEPGARVTGAPFRSDGATIGVRAAAPRFAEHTRVVLAERCGLTADDLDRLEADGIIPSG